MDERNVCYRPELAKQLQNAMNDTLKLYQENILEAYYLLVSKTYSQSGDSEATNLLKNAANCASSEMLYKECFDKDYKDRLNNLQCGLGEVSEAQAANVVFFKYECHIENIRQSVLKSVGNLSKFEKFLIADFFDALKSPAHDPKLKIQEGELRCFYDNSTSEVFRQDLILQLGLMKAECEIIIKMFNRNIRP